MRNDWGWRERVRGSSHDEKKNFDLGVALFVFRFFSKIFFEVRFWGLGLGGLGFRMWVWKGWEGYIGRVFDGRRKWK